MNDLVSIIIPAYNSSNYIEKCIHSILSQTYAPIELIVVDDGSTDNTLSIIRTFNDVVVIQKENGGSSSARNAGLRVAKGKYIMFVDSDDWVEYDFVETHMKALSDSDNTIVMSDFVLNGKREHGWEQMEIIGTENIFYEYLNGGICNRIVNKIYPKRILTGVLFPVDRNIMEDAVWTSLVMERCNRIIRLDYAGYHYERRDGSLTKHRLDPKELAGREANRLDKDLVLFRNCPSNEQIVHKTISDLQIALMSSCDLRTFDLKKKITELATLCVNADVLLTNEEARVLKIVAGVSGIERQFFLSVMLHSSVRSKAKMCKNLIWRKVLKR